MINFFKKRKDRKARKRFREGYDYAAGHLLSEYSSIEELEEILDNSGNGDSFDKGALLAILDYKLRMT